MCCLTSSGHNSQEIVEHILVHVFDWVVRYISVASGPQFSHGVIIECRHNKSVKFTAVEGNRHRRFSTYHLTKQRLAGSPARRLSYLYNTTLVGTHELKRLHKTASYTQKRDLLDS